MKFRLDPRLYEGATAAREQEWRLALTDLNRDADGEEPTLTVTRRPDGLVELLVSGRPGAREDRIALTRELMRSHFRDYRQVIERLARSQSAELAALETLDYAKKVVHDEAGEVLARVLSTAVALPHALARRLFTLVFLVSTELPEALVRRHRREG